MDRSVLMNVGNRLKEPLDEELSKIEPLRVKALSSKATLGEHTDYNIAFEHARKNYEAEVSKTQRVVEESVAMADKEIAQKLAAAQTDLSAVQACEAERTKLTTELEKLQKEIAGLEGSNKSVSSSVVSNGAPREEDGLTEQELAADSAFFQEYESTVMNVRTCLFRVKNKLSPPSEDEIRDLRRQAKALQELKPANKEPYNSVMHEVERLVEDVTVHASLVQNSEDRAVAGAASVSSETEAILTKRKQQEDDFMKESAKLLHWCRQQKTDLEALTEPDHIQKFCSALEVNYKTMYDNFEMLSAMGQELIGKQPTGTPSCYRVESTLMECNEVWLNLLVYAHEILQHTMLEIHARSKLEDEVRAFSSYSTRFRETLSSLREMFSLPMDEESKEVVAGVLEQTEALEKNFEPFKDLGDSLKDFSLRMECIRDNYQNLRRTVLARLTFLSAQNQAQSIVASSASATSTSPTASMRNRRLEEYTMRMKDLNEWVTKKDSGESVSEIHARIEAIKALIDREYEAVHKDIQQMAQLTA